MELSDSRYRILQPNQMEESSNTANFTTNTRSTGAGAAASSSLPDATDEVQEGNRTRREHMFAKVVTPSDVGKLNRLVIPKQHAEKYFPLEACSNDQKGLLLNFEDSSGKSWRFRYSYWNSSQSYVMTKGWSRFVKEKKLIAGDTVSFERTVNQSGEACRLFIGWKRRPNAPPDSLSLLGSNLFWPISSDRPTTVPSWRHGGYSRDYYGYGLGYVEPQLNPLFYLRAGTRPTVHRERPDAIAVTRHDISPTATLESVPLVHVKTAAKRVRLFGVNLDCHAAMEEEDEDEEETDGSTCGIGGSVCDVRDGISCSSSMPNWFPQNPSEHLQSKLLAGENTQLLTLPTFSQPALSRKSKPPSLSFNL